MSEKCYCQRKKKPGFKMCIRDRRISGPGRDIVKHNGNINRFGYLSVMDIQFFLRCCRKMCIRDRFCSDLAASSDTLTGMLH